MIRRIATILLLAFLLFNWVGYRLLISWYESRESAGWEARLDSRQYDPDQLVLFKVSAAAVPYSTASATFERADGELEVGNIHYRYVLKRLYNDSVEFLCLHDSETGRIQHAKNEIIHLAVDGPDGNNHGRPSPAGKISPSLLTIFFQQIPAWDICNFPAREKRMGVDRVPPLCAGHASMGWQPPRMS
ncbi:MAG TPA: hypothetical protein VGE93_23450 [Bryobacteraceae bacterium]